VGSLDYSPIFIKHLYIVTKKGVTTGGWCRVKEKINEGVVVLIKTQYNPNPQLIRWVFIVPITNQITDFHLQAPNLFLGLTL